MTKTDPKAIWTAVDDYFAGLLAPMDSQLEAALKANHAANLPAIDVSPMQGKFLQVLVQMLAPRRVLEVGLLGGYSTIWMARALPEGGRILSLELEPRHAEIARKNLKNAGVLDRVEIRVGAALDLLPAIASGPDRPAPFAPFDLIFIDADKGNNPSYLEWALRLSRTGTVIVVDNVVREGKVIDAKNSDPDVRGTRRMAELMAAEPRLSATVLQNVGPKGYDGFVLAVVR